MSELSNLSELARFVSKARPAPGIDQRRRVSAGLTVTLDPRPQRRSVGELLGVVLALSARTRRMVMPKVGIDLDVFAPGGKRAVSLWFGGRN
ncbi:MAG TPA: hypothetical protein VGM83_05880 [Devosiaceae bacterium]|jgi:hypothetical protein